MSEDSTDGFFSGRLRLRQGRGHRAGTDAVLLAAVIPAAQTGVVLDVGAGAGAVGLMAAIRAPGATIGLVEIEPRAATLARENVVANGLADRVSVFEADVTAPRARRAAGLPDEKAALVLTNPPFYDMGRVRVTPDAGKALAHVAAVPLADWARACLALLAPGGVFAMIHRADALAECLAAVEGRLGAVSILPVSARAGAPATRILLRGMKGSKAPLSLLAPMVLHEADGRFTSEMERLSRGEARLFA